MHKNCACTHVQYWRPCVCVCTCMRERSRACTNKSGTFTLCVSCVGPCPCAALCACAHERRCAPLMCWCVCVHAHTCAVRAPECVCVCARARVCVFGWPGPGHEQSIDAQDDEVLVSDVLPEEGVCACRWIKSVEEMILGMMLEGEWRGERLQHVCECECAGICSRDALDAFVACSRVSDCVLLACV